MQRIKSFDLARGFTVLMIAPIHTVMLYSRPEIHQTVFGNVLAFIAEGPGAQLFMMLMGVYFSFHQQQTVLPVLSRSIILLLIGYGLNAIKFVIPLLLGLLPAAVQSDLQVDNDPQGLLHLLLIGDILHFAALASIILYYVMRVRKYHYAALIAATLICFCSPMFWDMTSTAGFTDYMLQLIGGQPPRIYFPLMPWLVYPLVGLAIGYFLQNDNKKLFPHLRNIGLGLLVGGLLLEMFVVKESSVSFYRTFPASTLQHIGIVLVILCIWEWMSKYVASNYFFTLLTYMSRNITQVYIIQWIVIAWLLPVFGYQDLNFSLSILAILSTTLITLAISLLINAIRRKRIIATK
jgi:uncharacterized membrane protein